MSIKPCPACVNDDLHIERSPGRESLRWFCPECGVTGPWGGNPADADAAWNAMPRHDDGLAWRSEPPDRPMTRMMVEHLKDHARDWTGNGEIGGLNLRHTSLSRSYIRSVIKEWDAEKEAAK